MNQTFPKVTLQTFRAWEAHFAGIPPFERRVLQMLGIWFQPMRPSFLLSNLVRSGVKTDSDLIPTMRDVDNAFRLLKGGDFIERVNFQEVICRPAVAEIAARASVADGSFSTLCEPDSWMYSDRWSGSGDPVRRFARELGSLRKAIYNNDLPAFMRIVKQVKIPDTQCPGDLPLFQVVLNPFDSKWFSKLDFPFQVACADIFFGTSVRNLAPLDEFFTWLKARASNPEGPDDHLSTAVAGITAEYLFLQGRTSESNEIAARVRTVDCIALSSALAFLSGNLVSSKLGFQHGIDVLKKRAKGKSSFFYGFSGYIFMLSLLRDGSPASRDEALQVCRNLSKRNSSAVAGTFFSLEDFLLKDKGRNFSASLNRLKQGAPLISFCHMLTYYWMDMFPASAVSLLENFIDLALAGGFQWLAEEMKFLWERVSGKPLHALLRFPPETTQPEFHPPLCSIIARQEAWEATLQALGSLLVEKPSATASKKPARLVWELSILGKSPKCFPNLIARQQTLRKNGTWSSGKEIRSERAYSQGLPGFFTDQDMKAFKQLYKYNPNFFSGGRIFKALLLLVGHPLVFDGNKPTQLLEIVRGEPELLVREQGSAIDVRLSVILPEGQDFIVERESPSRVKIFEIKPEYRRLARILHEPVNFPQAARERLVGTMASLSRLLPVHSDIGGVAAGATETVAADGHLHLLLSPDGGGVRAVLMVRPFGDVGPAFHPGRGGKELFVEVEGKTRHTSRDLAAETGAAKSLSETCPSLSSLSDERFEVSLPDPDEALQLLAELKAPGAEVIVEWPQGKNLPDVVRAESTGLRLSMHDSGDWLAVEGDLTCDEGLVLELSQILTLLETSPGRFIRLDDQHFLALSEQFKRRLNELAAFSEARGKGRRIHPLAALALEDELPMGPDNAAWKQRLDKYRKAENLAFEIPSTLTAELRDYQVTAFRWLCRMGEGGIGACLADDMGLGKTVEALALVLHRAAAGPTLVVAPTSVCLNWESETRRFAPTLNSLIFGSGDRKARVNCVGPFDLLICSYGLLQQESEILGEVEWETIILDEAQSIKNLMTQRSKAAMSLRGNFRMIMTGTPIENHLGELWNLFHFINPGLLGSLDRFNRNFGIPIQKNSDKQAQSRLKKLVQPFIMRRTKNQVLQELPSRTEITLKVEPGPDEAAFYEALRRKAVERLSGSADTGGKRHFRILAEIMKLRRFCCHPKLVVPESGLQSPKLAVLADLLVELRDGRHKALIFSQFVDFLAIVRQRLDELDLHYKYLDGSTPPHDRKKAVEEFQAGQGDFFLISLKAGGLGLNLTAADYVIHLDPWWNPAVEDQASDRAHRIGQQRPVTIYRLVTRDSIEEKILQLHQKKRDLADGLLEGTDMAGSISAEQLLQLLQD